MDQLISEAFIELDYTEMNNFHKIKEYAKKIYNTNNNEKIIEIRNNIRTLNDIYTKLLFEIFSNNEKYIIMDNNYNNIQTIDNYEDLKKYFDDQNIDQIDLCDNNAIISFKNKLIKKEFEETQILDTNSFININPINGINIPYSINSDGIVINNITKNRVNIFQDQYGQDRLCLIDDNMNTLIIKHTRLLAKCFLPHGNYYYEDSFCNVVKKDKSKNYTIDNIQWLKKNSSTVILDENINVIHQQSGEIIRTYTSYHHIFSSLPYINKDNIEDILNNNININGYIFRKEKNVLKKKSQNYFRYKK